MKINVSLVKKEIGCQQPFSFRCDIAQLFAEPQQEWTSGQITVKGNIINNGRLLEVSGTISVVATLICGRCLEEAEAEFTIPFHEFFRENGDTCQQEDMETITFFQGDEIDISDLVRETIILSEPLRFVCREDCKGLCPDCGVNLNEQSCGCAKDIIDPRLIALAKLLNKE